MLRQWPRRTVLHSAHGLQRTRLHTFAAGDNVLLCLKSKTTELFISGLKPGKSLITNKGVISHDDIIGQTPRSFVPSRTKSNDHYKEYRLQDVTLGQYIKLSKRLVTPIYPEDAHLIVDLFDLHPETFDSTTEPQKKPAITILEAGTGHGALTLYLSRAIHAANSPAPRPKAYEDEEAYDAAFTAWKATRRAVIHTVEINSIYSKHASNIVNGFRQGMYRPNVDFHVSSVGSWVEERLAAHDQQPFLTHAFLDLPEAQKHISAVARALHVDSTLIVFTPSITQNLELTIKAKNEGTPLYLDKVLELGVNGGTGGREWDVRPVPPPREPSAVVSEQALDSEDSQDGLASKDLDTEEGDAEAMSEASHKTSGRTVANTASGNGSWAMVCRPKVGERITGGGFLAIYKKRQV